MDNVSQFKRPDNTVIQRRNPWAQVLPNLVEAFGQTALGQMVKQYADKGKLDQGLQAQGYEQVPDGTPPDPTRQTRTINGKTYYVPTQDVYGLSPTGEMSKMGTVPEGAKIQQLPQAPDMQLWRKPSTGESMQLPKNDPRGQQLLQGGFLPISASFEAERIKREGQPTPSMQESVAKAAFIQEHGREPDAKEWNDLLQTTHHPEMNLTGGTYTPEQRGLAKKLVAGEIPYPSSFALRSPYWQGIIQAAQEEDPAFNAATYSTRAAVRKSFTSGPDARNVTSINTLVGHLNSLEKSAKQLDNRSWGAWNTVANFLETETGDPRTTKFGMDIDAVSSELAAVFKGTGASDQEIKAWRGRINSSQSPEQLDAAINEGYELMFSRLGALRQKYDQGMGAFGQMQILSPKSRGILSKRFGPDYISALEPEPAAGGTHTSGTPQGAPQPGQRNLKPVLDGGW